MSPLRVTLTPIGVPFLNLNDATSFFDNVANAIRKNSINLSSGNIKAQTGTLQLATRNLGDSLEDFNEIVILQTPDGGKIKVSDVATVVDGFEDKTEYTFTHKKKKISKQVWWYIAETETIEVDLSHEHQDYLWLEWGEAKKQLTHDESRAVLQSAHEFMKKNR